MKELYNKSNDLKEIEEDTNKMESYPMFTDVRINLVKISILHSHL